MFNTEDRFNFFVPINIEKSGNGSKKMKIKGIASTGDKDSQGEVLLPSGFDLSRFLKIGFFNYNHESKGDPTKIIGYPTKAEVNSKGQLYVEGELYEDSKLAKDVWQLAEILEKDGSGRRLGFSIEGLAKERDPLNPKIVKKAEITGCAVTPTPVNHNTLMELVKGNYTEQFYKYEYSVIKSGENDILYKSIDPTSNKEYIINKDLTISIKDITVNKFTDEFKESFMILTKAFNQGKLNNEQITLFKGLISNILD